MQDIDLSQFEPVTDPDLIALAETPQKDINKGLNGAPPMSASVSNYINGLRDQSQSASNSLTQYQRAAEVLARSKMTPTRAAQVESAIPQEGGGLTGALGALFRRTINGVDEQEIADFQYLQGLQSGQVLDRQIEQKGPQTESDALRLKLTEISPFKSMAANAEVISDGALRSRLLSRKAPFYVAWHNKYGMNGVDEHGRTADDVWLSVLEAAKSNLGTQEDLRGSGLPALGPQDLNEYRALQQSGATPEELQTFVLNKTGGRGRLANAEEIAGARFVPGKSDKPEYEGWSVERVN